MIFLLAPAKRLDMSACPIDLALTEPLYHEEMEELVAHLNHLSKPELKKLLEVSDDLAELNYQRFKDFKGQPSKAAVLAFNGDAYIGLAASSMSMQDLEWAQSHVRILSGLYGTLRPLDGLKPYRLNMGTKLKVQEVKNLYEYWGDKVALALGQALADETRSTSGISMRRHSSEGKGHAGAAAASADGAGDGDDHHGDDDDDEVDRRDDAHGDGGHEGGENVIVNTASAEYFKAVDAKALPSGTRVIEAVFKEANGTMPSFFAKKARGMMVRHAILNRIVTVEGLKSFTGADGEYSFKASESNKDKLVFIRSAKPKRGKEMTLGAREAAKEKQGVSLRRQGLSCANKRVVRRRFASKVQEAGLEVDKSSA